MNRNLTATVLIIVGIGIYFTVTRSMYADAQAVKAKNDQLTSALNNAQEIIKARTQVTDQYNAIPPKDRLNLDKMIPSSVDNIRLVIDLNRLALQKNFSISNVKATVASNTAQPTGSAFAKASQTPAVGAGGFSSTQYISEAVLDKVDLTFRATATYEQFIDFLRATEASLRIMDLTHLSIKANDSGSYEFDVAFQVYWLRQ